MKKYAIVILAAGRASRMGRPKQLLLLGKKTIIEHIVSEAVESNCGDIFVVLGAYYEEVLRVISDYPINIIFNENFEEGMGSSIVAAAEKIENYDGVLILLADQIFTTRRTIFDIFELYEKSKSSIVRSDYGKGGGAPVFFDKKYFNALKKLIGDEGAKKIVRQNQGEVANYFFPKGALDVDTPEDFERFLNQKE